MVAVRHFICLWVADLFLVVAAPVHRPVSCIRVVNGLSVPAGKIPQRVQLLFLYGFALETICNQLASLRFFDTFTQVRLSFTCVVILVDRSEVALASTEWRLGLALSSWTVPTPPVAAYFASEPSVSDSADEL